VPAATAAGMKMANWSADQAADRVAPTCYVRRRRRSAAKPTSAVPSKSSVAGSGVGGGGADGLKEKKKGSIENGTVPPAPLVNVKVGVPWVPVKSRWKVASG